MDSRPDDQREASFDEYLREGTLRTLADTRQGLSIAHATEYMDAVKARHQLVLKVKLEGGLASCRRTSAGSLGEVAR